MSQAEIYSQLTPIFHDIFDDDSIVLTPETSATDIDSWDSFNHINLVIAIQKAFAVKFSTAELEQVATVGDIVALLEKKSVPELMKSSA